jgi:hypothetical protein
MHHLSLLHYFIPQLSFVSLPVSLELDIIQPEASSVGIVRHLRLLQVQIKLALLLNRRFLQLELPISLPHLIQITQDCILLH